MEDINGLKYHKEIRLKRKYCPLCEKLLVEDNSLAPWSSWREHYCPSECYRYRTNHLYNITYIFNEKFVEEKSGAKKYSTTKVSNAEIRTQIKKSIDYWKTNNRYVAELLAGFERDPNI